MAAEIQRKIWQERKQLRQALSRAYALFTHETEFASLDPIRATGLEPRNPGVSSDDHLINELGVTQRGMVCLHPVGSNPDVRSTKHGPFMLLAVRAAGLPEDVTLDWSWPGCWGLAPVLEADGLNGNYEGIFLEIVQRRGSVAVLGAIAPRHLHVLCHGPGADTPHQWRPLPHAAKHEVCIYSAIGRPCVVPDCPATINLRDPA